MMPRHAQLIVMQPLDVVKTRMHLQALVQRLEMCVDCDCVPGNRYQDRRQLPGCPSQRRFLAANSLRARARRPRFAGSDKVKAGKDGINGMMRWKVSFSKYVKIIKNANGVQLAPRLGRPLARLCAWSLRRASLSVDSDWACRFK